MNTSKIIKGVVGGGRYTVTAPIIKEDYGLYLQIEGPELPSTYEVDFSNDEHSGSSVTMIGNSDGVLIPRQFISSGKDVFAFLYHVGVDFGRTVYKFRIPNKLRPDRTNEEPTPEEQSVIDQTIAALNTAVAKTAQDVIDADASAQSASADAERAEEARTDAQNYAEQAKQSATNVHESASQASASATASANSASQSAQIKADVEGMVDDAQASADASYQNAQTAERYARDSATSARQAESYANGASGYESQAQASAETASRKASEASQSAQTASQKATESAQSASQALTYKTDAETAKTASQTAQGLAESARDTAVQAKNDAESARDTAQTLVDGITGKVEQIDQNTADIASLEEDRYKPYVVDSASGSIASFPDGADDIPLKSLVVDINPVQDLSHGDPSPDNICPISGWTEVDVNHSDADMTNPTIITIDLGQTVYGGKLDVINGVLTVDMAMVDLGTLNWKYTATNNGVFYQDLPSNAKLLIGTAGSMCSMFAQTKGNDWQALANGDYILRNGLNSIGRCCVAIRYNEYTVPADFKTAVTGQTLVYELATPLEIQLDAHAINSLYGVNNIWADSGDTEVVYRADTKLFIERLTAPDSADMIADANITSGQYFMVGNNLFKATANIANGSAIIVGTNCTRKSLSEALNEINA